MLAWLSLKDVVYAQARIEPYIRETPLVRSRDLSDQLGADVFLKLECWQRTRSFKVRGALNRLLRLSDEERQRGVVAASAGNHAQGVAYAAGVVGTEALLVVPKGTPRTKLQGTLELGGAVREDGADYDESERIARQLAHDKGYVFVHGFTDPDVVAGQGTIALEMLQQMPELGVLLVPVGGGGLISGIALAAKTLDMNIKVVGVQSEASCPMAVSFHAGEMTEVEFEPTIADGLYGGIAEETLAMVLGWVDDMIVVTETETREAVRWLLAHERLVVEGSGAVGVAAILSGRVHVPESAHVGIVISGGNIDFDTLSSVL